jgi:hypothetical protein
LTIFFSFSNLGEKEHKMKMGWSDRIRDLAEREYVNPARVSGGKISIRVGDIQKKLKAQGFPAGYTNQILTSLESHIFWERRGLEMDTPPGQPRRHETVLTFRFKDGAGVPLKASQDPLLELKGLLRGAIREGADAFVRELRRDKEVTR